MANGNERTGGKPLSEDKDGPLAQDGWHGGATFFEETGGRSPAPPGRQAASASGGTGSGDGHLPASESGTGIIPEDDEKAGGDVHRPASESDTDAFGEEDEAPAVSWPGGGGPGTIPPPG